MTYILRSSIQQFPCRKREDGVLAEKLCDMSHLYVFFFFFLQVPALVEKLGPHIKMAFCVAQFLTYWLASC